MTHIATIALDSVENIAIDVDEVDGEKLVFIVDEEHTRAIEPSAALRLAAALTEAAKAAVPALRLV